jgi:hypothetical protein
VSLDDLIRFARRDWALVAQAKDRHWLRQKRAMTVADLWRRSDDLLRHARTGTRFAPQGADRLEDLRVHQRVGQSLRAVTRAAR